MDATEVWFTYQNRVTVITSSQGNPGITVARYSDVTLPTVGGHDHHRLHFVTPRSNNYTPWRLTIQPRPSRLIARRAIDGGSGTGGTAGVV